ncbi:hypothetical protein [Gordonia sp. DT101]|uniref:hypothetical protein n=1 Tax=Gordonia sp. DT101 TaxID=3416545 RepID=UPI003CEF28EB
MTDLKITTPSGYGSVADRYGTGCEYDVEATINNTTPKGNVQYFIADPDGIGSPKTTKAVGTKATFTFTPDKPGTWTIKARQADNVNSSKQITWVTKTVQVGQGFEIPDTGSVKLPFSGCVVLP